VIQLELPLLQFVPVAPCPIAGHHWTESGPILLTPTLQIFMNIYNGGFIILRIRVCESLQVTHHELLSSPVTDLFLQPAGGTACSKSPSNVLR